MVKVFGYYIVEFNLLRKICKYLYMYSSMHIHQYTYMYSSIHGCILVCIIYTSIIYIYIYIYNPGCMTCTYTLVYIDVHQYA